MPYTVSGNTYPTSHTVPQNLSHKPVYVLPYEHFDGQYAGNTDAFYLSVGIAQYDSDEISAKVMRFSGDQWSPQAEELPIHRPIDLSILIAKALFDASDNSVLIKGGTYSRQLNGVQLIRENRTNNENEVYDAWVNNNGDDIRDRLNELCDVLLDLRRRNRI